MYGPEFVEVVFQLFIAGISIELGILFARRLADWWEHYVYVLRQEIDDPRRKANGS